jgi:sulfonate transport system substrate-binding protein
MNATDPNPTGPILRPILRRPLIAAALAPVALLASLALVSGCATTTPSASPKTPKIAVPADVPAKDLASLTLNVGDQKAELQSLLAASGELKDLPYKIKWATFTSGTPELEAVNAGAIDYASTGNTPPIFSAAAGGKVIIVSAGRDTAKGDAVVVPKGSTVRTVADLKGKRVAVAKGSSGHGNLLLQLRKAGLRPSDVETTFLTPSDGYVALSSGRVDAWVVWDPYTAQAEQQLGARVISNGKGVANGLSLQMASQAALADPIRTSAIKDFLIRTVRAQTWSDAHIQLWARLYAGKSGLSYGVSLATAQRSNDKPTLLTPQLIASEQKLADAFADAKVIPTRPKIADIVDTRYNQALSDAGARP